MIDHTLEDELPVTNLARLQFLLDGILAALEAAHAENRFPVPRPSEIVITATDEIRLVGESHPVTQQVNMQWFGRMMYQLVPPSSDRTVRLARALAADCEEKGTPPQVMRENLRTHLQWLTGPPPPPSTAHFIPNDVTEQKLVAALRANPDDLATTQVYADWLEQNGFPTRAQFLRNQRDAVPEDLSWRAVISRAPLLGCSYVECEHRWDLLPGDDDELRTCATCQHGVRYCTNLQNLFGVIAVDASLPIEEARAEYERRKTIPLPAMNPPAPRR